MYIDILIEALDNLYENTLYPDYKRSAVKEALDEAYAQKDLMDYELLKGNVHIVSLTTALETINQALYDDFGRSAKMHKKNNVPYTFNKFYTTARSSYLSDITVDMLRDGFEYLEDLWNDNEVFGNNNPDGTFRCTSGRLSSSTVETIHNALSIRQRDLQDCILDAYNEEDCDRFQSELIDICNAIEELERIYP